MSAEYTTPTSITRQRSFQLFVIEMAAMCWPALVLNRGQPIIFYDTGSYYVAGHGAVMKLLSMLQPGSANAGLDGAIRQARAVRSVFYSLFTYLSAGSLSLWLLVSVQATIIVLLLRLAFRLSCPMQPASRGTLVIVLLALFTPISWVVSNVMPDVFTPVAVLSTTIAVFYWQRLGTVARCLLFFAVAVGCVMHLTNPPIVVGMLIIGALLTRRNASFMRFVLPGAAVAMALCLTLAASVVGFGHWTLTPNQPPFLMARSIDDGPGKLYLREHCPDIGLLMCQHLDRLDVGSDAFLWHQDGVYSVVSLDDAARLRIEDKPTFIAAALEHPWLQLQASSRNVLLQLCTFDLTEYFIPSSASADGLADATFTRYTLPATTPTWKDRLAIPEYAVMVLSVGYLLVIWRRLDRQQRGLVLLTLAAVVGNAMAAGVFSTPSPRYEARVIWLIPMVALLIYHSITSSVRSAYGLLSGEKAPPAGHAS